MNRRTVTFLAAGAVLLAAFASAAMFLGPPRIFLSDSTSDADHVTLYQNGLAFVELSRTFESSGGESLLVVALPTSARFDSLSVEGADVTVKSFRSSLAVSGSLQPGDVIVVHTSEGNFAGTYLGNEGGALILAAEAGIVTVQSSKVTAVEITGRTLKESGPGSVEAIVLVEAPAGRHDVRVTYLAQGTGWTPSYELDADTGRIAFFATLTGLDNWKNITLDLVSGSPNVVLSPTTKNNVYGFEAAPAAADAAGARYAPGFGGSEALGDLHRYRYAEPIDFARGETVRLAVETGKVDIKRHYYDISANGGWGFAAGERNTLDVRERIEIRNTLDEPLPPGVVRAYRDGTWIGEDMLVATPKGDLANLTLSKAEEVKAKVVLEAHTSAGNTDTYTYGVVVENFKATPVEVHVSFTYPTYRTRLMSTSPTPTETLGSTIIWDGAVADETKSTYRVTYETTTS